MPSRLATRLALVLLIVLVPTYLIFFALLRLQVSEAIAPRVAQSLAMTIIGCRDSLNGAAPADVSSWIAKFNRLGRMRLSAAPPESTPIASASPAFALNLQAELREEIGNDIEIVRLHDPSPLLSVTFNAGGVRYRLSVPIGRLESNRIGPFIWLFVAAAGLIWIAIMFVIWQVNRPLHRIIGKLTVESGKIEPISIATSTPEEFRGLFEKYNALCQRLDEHETERRMIAAGVSHDLRAPLTRIRLRAELIDDLETSAALARDADAVTSIINHFVEFFGDSVPPIVSAIDIAPQIGEIVSQYMEMGHSVSFVKPVEFWVVSDRLSIRRSLENLIENALTYGRPPIEVSVIAEAGWRRIRVFDHGWGIAEAEVQRALKPFERMDPARAAQGHCGLGLAIVRRLLRPLGGTLTLETRENGFLATLSLPAPQVADGTPQSV